MISNRWFSLMSRLFAAVVVSAMVVMGGVHANAARPASSSSNTLTIGWNEDSSTMDPTGVISNYNIYVYVNIYDQLLRVNNNGRTLDKDLATSWKITNGGKTYTFHLRKNVKFSNGQKLKASDVVFCLKRAALPSSNFSFLLPKFKTITAPNNSTVVLTLTQPWAPLLSDLALYATAIYPESYFKKVGAKGLANKPIGTGPYELKTWKKGQYLLLTKNPHYWASKKFPMKQIEFEVIPNDQTRLLKVESGQLDVDNVLPTTLIPQAQSSSGVKVQINKSTDVIYVTLNDKLSQFADAKVRQAINHAIDRKALVKAVLRGYGTPANSFIPKGALYWEPTSKLPVPSHNLKLAKKLLKQSKHKKGFSMTFEVSAGDQEYTEIATILQSELKPLGIKLQLKNVDPTTLQTEQQADHFHMLATNWTNDIPDPDELTSFAVDSSLSSHTFFTWYSDKKLNQLSEQGERTTSASKRQKIYYQIQSRWAQDTPYYALYYEPFINAVSSRVKGFAENPLGYFVLQGVKKS
ncbi:MAG TPA: ABC transporter substrate-binding protein [Chloroflexota bacterium]|nr:ABC transporter substrate-binding protein [Chloroflexota bacterium]